MQRTTASRGKVGRLVAGADSVEIKATISRKQISRGMKRFELDEGKAEKRFIYFFDTPGLALFRGGVIVRARRVVGKGDNSTIKIRPVRADKVPARWHKEEGFKIEADASEKGTVLSASLTKPVGKGLIKSVEDRKASLPTLLGKTQELYLAEMATVRYDLAGLSVLGPMESLCWKTYHPGLPWPVSSELWRRDDGGSILEVSVRVPVAQAAVANAGFFAFLAELGAERDNAQQTKTRWAMDYYVSKLARPAKPRQPRRKVR